MEHNGCRIKEFACWPRLVLEHERAHISRAMAGRAFKSQEEIDGLMHDLADLDWLLSQLPVRVKVDGRYPN
jgi:hypothetical protein